MARFSKFWANREHDDFSKRWKSDHNTPVEKKKTQSESLTVIPVRPVKIKWHCNGLCHIQCLYQCLEGKQRKVTNTHSHLLCAGQTASAMSYVHILQQCDLVNGATSWWLGIEANFLDLIKGIYEKSTANIIFNGERTDAFPLRSRTK